MGSAFSNIISLTLPVLTDQDSVQAGGDFLSASIAAFLPPTNNAVEDIQSGADFLAGAFTAVDPFFGEVSLLLTMDGVNGSTSFIDSSNNANVMTASGVTVSTAGPMFGSGAADFGIGGAGHNITCPATDNGPLDFSTRDFTIEFWVKWNVFPGGNTNLVSSKASGSSGFVLLYDLGTATALLSMQFVGGIGNTAASHSFVPVLGTWYALAACRQGNLFGVWLNGVAGGTPTSQAGSLGNVAGLFTVGSSPLGGALNGQIDELRVTMGLARYTPGINYVPSGPFPTS